MNPQGQRFEFKGDPIALSVFWFEGDRKVERPYQDFAQEKVLVNGGEMMR